MEPEEELDELLVAACDGHPWAFTDIWTRLAPSVQGFVRSRGAREPEDMTSEVFLAAFKALPTFRGGWRDFRGLVFTIARRRVVDELRALGRRPTPLPWSEEDEDRVELSAEERALEQVSDRDVRALLDTLAPDQRDVLTLRIFGDLTVEQVATTIGKSVGAVKQLQRRGLEALRRRPDPLGTGGEFGRTRNPPEPPDDASGRP
jgi:RNA polymerase sigma-70 factor (ECF subfamily)